MQNNNFLNFIYCTFIKVILHIFDKLFCDNYLYLVSTPIDKYKY